MDNGKSTVRAFLLLDTASRKKNVIAWE